MIARALIATALLLLAGGARTDAAQSGLEDVRRLYAEAAYEDALRALSTLDGRDDPNRLDQFRALCLVGLGRLVEADQVLERIVMRSPQFTIPSSDASPAFIARFTTVRKRALPIAANRLYARAKTTFDLKNFTEAADQLRELLGALQAEPSNDASLAGLQRSAEGLLRLTEAELAAASRMVYTTLDKDVTPPVELERKVPAWNPPSQLSWRWFRGVVEVVVDENGGVESARLVESLADFYDAGLLEAARSWRFKPAERNGRPVKYRKLVEITMR